MTPNSAPGLSAWRLESEIVQRVLPYASIPADARLPGASRLPLWADLPTFAAFAERVGESIDGGVLRYSARHALLREAKHLGIGRFDANLVIAMVQHRTGTKCQTAKASPRAGRSVLAAFALTQAAIVASVCWLFLR